MEDRPYLWFSVFVNRMERLARKYAYESSNYVSNVVEPEAKICIYRKEVFDSSLLLSFEKESFEVPILYQEYLKIHTVIICNCLQWKKGLVTLLKLIGKFEYMCSLFFYFSHFIISNDFGICYNSLL